MPAANAAAPSVSGDSQVISATGAPAAEPVAQPTPTESTSSLGGVAGALGLPADIVERISADAAERQKAESGDGKKAERRTSNVERRTPNSEENGTGEQTDATADVEHEEEVEHEEHEEGQPDVFLNPKVQKRLGKEARQRERMLRAAGFNDEEIAEIKESRQDPAEAIADRLQSKAASQPPQFPGPQAPVGKGVIGSATNEQQLDAWEDQAVAQIDWCDANPEGVTVGEGAQARFVEPTEIARHRKEMEKLLLQAPRRRQQIRDALGQQMATAQKFNAIAQKENPALWDVNSEEHKALSRIGAEDEVIQTFARNNPQALNDPTINVILTRYLAGMEALAAGNGSVAHLDPDLPPSLVRKHPPLAPVTADPPTRSAAPNGTKRVAEAMQNVVASGGDRESMIAAIRAKREAGAFGKPASGRSLVAV